MIIQDLFYPNLKGNLLFITHPFATNINSFNLHV